MSENDGFSQLHSASMPQTPGRRESPRRARLAGYLVGVVLAVSLAAAAFWLVTSARDASTAPDTSQKSESAALLALQRPVVSDDGLAEASGVKIVQVALTGGGGLIDLRFQVVDPDKAYAIHDEDTPPALVDDTTGVVVDQLLMGHSHTGSFTAGQTYYLVFENPGDLVQRGSTVSVLLGNAEVDHVSVK